MSALLDQVQVIRSAQLELCRSCGESLRSHQNDQKVFIPCVPMIASTLARRALADRRGR